MILLISLSSNALAYNVTNTDTKYYVPSENTVENQFTKAEILTLEKYIYLNQEGLFELNKKQAKNDGIKDSLLNGQQEYFYHINSLIKNGEITVGENLVIYNNSRKATATASHWPSCGGGVTTNSEYHWWGYSRYTCDCLTQDISSDLNSVAGVAAGITLIAACFGPIPALPPGLTSAYFWVLASRLDANNHGRGVYIEMTWALAFDITPQ